MKFGCVLIPCVLIGWVVCDVFVYEDLPLECSVIPECVGGDVLTTVIDFTDWANLCMAKVELAGLDCNLKVTGLIDANDDQDIYCTVDSTPGDKLRMWWPRLWGWDADNITIPLGTQGSGKAMAVTGPCTTQAKEGAMNFGAIITNDTCKIEEFIDPVDGTVQLVSDNLEVQIIKTLQGTSLEIASDSKSCVFVPEANYLLTAKVGVSRTFVPPPTPTGDIFTYSELEADCLALDACKNGEAMDSLRDFESWAAGCMAAAKEGDITCTVEATGKFVSVEGVFCETPVGDPPKEWNLRMAWSTLASWDIQNVRIITGGKAGIWGDCMTSPQDALATTGPTFNALNCMEAGLPDPLEATVQYTVAGNIFDIIFTSGLKNALGVHLASSQTCEYRPATGYAADCTITAIRKWLNTKEGNATTTTSSTESANFIFTVSALAAGMGIYIFIL